MTCNESGLTFHSWLTAEGQKMTCSESALTFIPLLVGEWLYKVIPDVHHHVYHTYGAV